MSWFSWFKCTYMYLKRNVKFSVLLPKMRRYYDGTVFIRVLIRPVRVSYEIRNKTETLA